MIKEPQGASPPAVRRAVVTGAAGFIGFHLCQRLLRDGWAVRGIDNLSPYYDVTLKEARVGLLDTEAGFELERFDLGDFARVSDCLGAFRPDVVVHLAAQAGVRYSLENPFAYGHSNLSAFLNLLESCRQYRPRHLVTASTSSVYGANASLPFSEHQGTSHPLTLYAASKKANEMMAHSYSHLFGLPVTALRFFTVYGPWGRPDMALFKFTRAILAGEPIEVFNAGDMQRDFTFVDDVVEAIVRVMDLPPTPDPTWDAASPDPAGSAAPFRIYNVGNSQPVRLLRYIEVLEACLGRKAEMKMLPMQAGDVAATWADTTDLERATGFRPRTTVEEGVRQFVDWYVAYYSRPGS